VDEIADCPADRLLPSRQTVDVRVDSGIRDIGHGD
jgi:hypothetical protein